MADDSVYSLMQDEEKKSSNQSTAVSGTRSVSSWVERDVPEIPTNTFSRGRGVPGRIKTKDHMTDDSHSMLQSLKSQHKMKQKELAEILHERKQVELPPQEESTKVPLETVIDMEDVSSIPDGQLEDIPSRSHSVDMQTVTAASSEEGSRSQTPMRDSHTYRERMRNRFQSTRERAASVVMEEVRPRARLRSLRRGVGAPTRFDELWSIEESEIEQGYEQHLKRRAKWKQSPGSLSKGFRSTQPSAEEAYDFFTRVWEDEATPSSSSVITPTKEASKEDIVEVPKPEDEEKESEHDQKSIEEEDVTDKVQLLVRDYLGDKDEWELLQMTGPTYQPLRERLANENKAYFVPSMLPVPLQDKLPADTQPRFLEDEGFYVGTRPFAPARNQNKLEHRLLKQNNKSWFGDDGQVLALPNPLRNTPSRPPVFEDNEPLLEVVYKPAVSAECDSHLIDGNVEGRGCYRLDVDISNLVFSHHSLFSKEHFLAQQLKELYQRYTLHVQQQKTERLTGKLEVLRKAVKNVLQLLHSSDGRDVESQTQRLHNYRKEVQETLKDRDEQSKAYRNLLKLILKIWKDLKSLREFQGYNNTTVKLQIYQEQVDTEMEKQQWEREVKIELEERKETYKEEYNRLLEEYQSKLSEWKKVHLARKEAKKRLKQRPKAENSDVSVNDNQQLAADEAMLQEPEEPKPLPPPELNMSEMKQKIEQRAHECRRPPGEPKLFLELSQTATITQTVHDAKEQQRRNSLHKHHIFIKIFYNQKEVCQSTPRVISSEFYVTFGQIFPIQIVQWPESLKVQIFEGSTIVSTMLAEIYIPIPDCNVSLSNAPLENHEFSSHQVISYTHAGVGSGTYFSPTPDHKEVHCVFTSGILCCKVGWGIGEDGSLLAPPVNVWTEKQGSPIKGLNPLSAFNSDGVISIQKLNKWFEQSHLDPNDPNNANLIQMIKNRKNKDQASTEYFRLDQLQEQFNFCTSSDIENTLRFHLLQLRESEVPEFRNLRMIPLQEKEIPRDILQGYLKRLQEEEHQQPREYTDPHHIRVNKYLQTVRQQVIQRFRQAQHQKQLQDIIVEEQVPNIGTFGITLMSIFQPRRPLKPHRKERKSVSVQNLGGQEVKIIINIVQAFNVPIRKDQDTIASSQSAISVVQSTGFREAVVRPFVEVSFQRSIVRTTVAEGPNPTWNQELQIPFRSPNEDYSHNTLQSVQDIIFFHLFDEAIIDLLEDERQRETNIHHRLEKRWLGSLKLPFSVLYFNSRIEGTFKMYCPPVLLGYENENVNQFGGPVWSDQLPAGKNATYLSIYVTILPALNPPDTIQEKLDTLESEKLLHHIETWQTDFKYRVPKREVKPLVIDINGKSTFILRYFRSLKPPEELLGTDKNSQGTAEILAHFVSLIPTVSDRINFPGLCDIWATCDQFLDMLSGDTEEHTVLLTNYFLYIGKKAWLLFGTGVPDGPTAYVLTEENEDYWIWNASTGEHFSISDSFIPLQNIWCLVNPDNIWANIQIHDEPSRVKFNLTQTANWLPLFSRSFPNPGLSSVQPEDLVYHATDVQYVRQLQEKMEKILRDHMMKWRKTTRTTWNRYCIATLRKLLPSLEKNHPTGKNFSHDHLNELQHIMGSHKLCGFPIHMPYTGMEAIIEAVYATGVHLNENSEVEFALATYIHPYPHTVLSVWVYVASLLKRR